MSSTDTLSTLLAEPLLPWPEQWRVAEQAALLAQARETGDKAKRAELYGKVQDIVYNDAYSVPLNFLPYVNGVQNYVKNWHNITVGWWWLRDVWLDK